MKIEKAKILVVDDELGMRQGIKRLFEMQGHEVVTAEFGQEGIDKGIQFEFDIYFIDLKIGDMDGIDVLRTIKIAYPEAICIIITAYASIDTAVLTTRMGAYHYVGKPFSPEELSLLVERALERRWYILESRRLREEQEHRLLEVAQEKSRMRTIINAIDDGILVINQQSELVLFNPRFLSLLNIQQTLRPGQPILDFLPESLQKQVVEILEKKSNLSGIEQEIVIEPPAKLVIMANTAAITDEMGHFLGVVSVLRDISELKQIEILKSQFVNMAAHELKAPLSAVMGYLEMVVDKTLGEAPDLYQGYLERSLERSRTLINLINDLLNISKIQAGTVRREIERVDLTELLISTIEFFGSEIEKRGLVTETDLQKELFADLDRDEAQRIFNNLISNAIKYNRPEGTIIIRAQREGHYNIISVKDTGIGLKPEEKERLFEEFFRAKNALTRNITGTGLGLTIVKKIVDSYAGKIRVESEFEKGSCFTVYLPVPGIETSVEG